MTSIMTQALTAGGYAPAATGTTCGRVAQDTEFAMCALRGAARTASSRPAGLVDAGEPWRVVACRVSLPWKILTPPTGDHGAMVSVGPDKRRRSVTLLLWCRLRPPHPPLSTLRCPQV